MGFGDLLVGEHTEVGEWCAQREHGSSVPSPTLPNASLPFGQLLSYILL